MNPTAPCLSVASTASGSFVSVAEAARMLRVSRTTVWRWIEAGKLPASRVGEKSIRIRQADLEKLVAPARETQREGGSALERIRFEKPSQAEITRRKAIGAKMVALRERLNIAPLKSSDVVRMAREEEESSYGEPRTSR